MTELDVQNGRLVNQYMLNSEHEVTSPESIIFVGSNTASALIVWPDQELKALRVNLIGSKSIHSVDIENGTEEPIRDIKVHASSTIPHFLVHYNTLTKSWADVFHLDIKQATISRAYQLPSVESTAAFALDTVENKLYFACITDSTVDLYSSESKKTLESRKIAQSPGAPRHATLQVVPRDSGFATRFAQVDESGDWVLIRNGEVGWHRPESLTDAVVAAWAEVNGVEALAHELELEGHQDVFSAYIHRLKRHAKGLQEHLLPWLQNLPTRVMSNFLSSEGAELRQFGFDKLVIVATRKGRALAIDFGREGAILWNVKIADSDGAWEPKAIYAQHEVATIFAADGSSVKLNVETGEVFEPLPPTGEYSSILLLQDTPAPVPVGIKADGTPSGLIPSLDGNQIIVTLSEDGILRGWNGVELTTPAWVFVPPRDQKIIQAITRPSHDPVASIGKVLGDRSVLYKYLNPNLALITAVADSTVTFYLLDGVSGQVLYTASQTGVETTQPISSVISENWFAYSFGAEISDSKGYQLVISELYESPIANDRGLLGDAANYSSIRTSTGFPRPHVISQAYMIPEPISNMAVTETRQGITVRQLLCTLPASNAIVGIPRFFLDPRRPVNRDPTSQEAEEGLMRYVSFLDFDPKWYLTHAREVMGIQKIESSPTLLESSTLVFAYGFDVFGTRLAPSQPFDLLGKGFSKMQLLLTVVALAAGVALLAPMVSLLSSIAWRVLFE